MKKWCRKMILKIWGTHRTTYLFCHHHHLKKLLPAPWNMFTRTPVSFGSLPTSISFAPLLPHLQVLAWPEPGPLNSSQSTFILGDLIMVLGYKGCFQGGDLQIYIFSLDLSPEFLSFLSSCPWDFLHSIYILMCPKLNSFSLQIRDPISDISFSFSPYS